MNDTHDRYNVVNGGIFVNDGVRGYDANSNEPTKPRPRRAALRKLLQASIERIELGSEPAGDIDACFPG